MSAGSIGQDAAIRLLGRTLPGIVAGTEQAAVEIAAMIYEAARDIAAAHDWGALRDIADFTTDGVATSFSLPTDYERTTLDGDLFGSWSSCAIPRVASPEAFVSPWANTIAYELRGNTIAFVKAPPSGTMKINYIKNTLFDASGHREVRPSSDTSECLLDDHAVMLSVVWRWRALKRLEYAEDMQNAERAVAVAIAKDKPRGVLSPPSRRFWSNNVFPGVITP